ncbi:MAG: PorV/PorQ family protein [Candidatus Zixiibacteriota bacterium]
MELRRRLIGGAGVVAMCVSLAVAPSSARAQDKVGTTGAQFLEVGVSPRADAVGGAFAAIADDASAIYYNPAGLVQLDHRQVMVSLIDYPADISYSFVGLAWPVAFGGVFGVAYYGLDAGDMPVTTPEYEMGAPGWTFTARDYAVSLSYGRYLTDRFSVGGTVKIIDELFEEERSTGWAADVGTQYNTGFRNFKIVMTLTNFGPDMKFITQPYPLPISFRFGGAIDVLDNPQHHAVFALEGAHPADNREKYNTGFEYMFRNLAALRIGHRFEHDLGGVTFGGGVHFALGGKLAARLDYGYQDFGALDQIHRFSMTVDF